MKLRVKEIRTLQIAAVTLIQNIPGAKVEAVFLPYMDLLVTLEKIGLAFGVKVVNTGFLKTNQYQQFFCSLTNMNVNSMAKVFPILVAVVNEEEEKVKIGFLLAWRNGRPHIYSKPSLKELNNNNAALILNIILSMDDSIRLLSEQGMKMVKKIKIREMQNGNYMNGTFVYLRDHTQKYKMNTPEIIDEREHIERLNSKLNSDMSQEEFPEDNLDQIIFEMIHNRFPSATKSSNMMWYSSNLRDLQTYSNYNNQRFFFNIIPEIDSSNASILTGFNSITFSVDLFLTSSPSNLKFQEFQNPYFEKIVPYDGWIDTYNAYTQALETMKRPQLFFI